ncbi:MAG: hypothetical protein HY537_07065, partial [Deltaproteobacteria bacterium]|nr:hypothetical protein [Deltaproteobacteria bacterium]
MPCRTLFARLSLAPFFLISLAIIGCNKETPQLDPELDRLARRPAAAAIPGTFSITMPTTMYVRSPIDVAWSAASNAVSYDLKIASSASCSSFPYVVNGILTTSTQLTLADGTYYLCMYANNSSGARAASNNGKKIMVDTVAPGAFAINSLTSPSKDNTPTISWGNSSGAAKYRVMVDNDADCSSPAYQIDNLTTTSRQVSPALPDATYFVCVTARDNAGNVTAASNSGILSVMIDTSAPPAVLSGQPANPSNATVLDVMVGGTDVVNYKYAFRNALNCNNASYSSSIPVSQAITGDIGVDGNKTLCVKGIDAAGNVQASPTQHSWIKDTVAPLVQLGGRPMSQSNATEFTLFVFGDSSQYRFSLLDNAPDCSSANYSDWIATTNSTAIQIGVDGPKRLCVIGRDAAGNETSNTATWTKDTVAPGAFSISSPLPLTGDSTPDVVWSASLGASSYDLKIDNEVDCPSPEQHFPSVFSTSKTLDLLGPGTYYVCLVAKDLAGNQIHAFNNPYSFAVDDTPPGSFSITAPPSSLPSPATISWSASSGATKYDFKVASDANCANVVSSQSDLTTTSAGVSLGDGTYHICVYAKDELARATSASNSGLSIMIDSTAPGAFAINSPPSPSNDNTPLISWGTSSGASKYHLKVDTLQD